MKLLEEPAQGIRFLQLAPGEFLFVSLKVAGYAGLTFALPYVLYEGLAFVMPGLNKRERQLVAPAVADLTLSATAHDFLLLAQRQQDPDTLFFSRRLSMEGDTELGLVVKNALDAIELPVLDPRQWAQRLAPREVLGHLRRRLDPTPRNGG